MPNLTIQQAVYKRCVSAVFPVFCVCLQKQIGLNFLIKIAVYIGHLTAGVSPDLHM